MKLTEGQAHDLTSRRRAHLAADSRRSRGHHIVGNSACKGISHTRASGLVPLLHNGKWELSIQIKFDAQSSEAVRQTKGKCRVGRISDQVIKLFTPLSK